VRRGAEGKEKPWKMSRPLRAAGFEGCFQPSVKAFHKAIGLILNAVVVMWVVNSGPSSEVMVFGRLKLEIQRLQKALAQEAPVANTSRVSKKQGLVPVCVKYGSLKNFKV
jgi:hypothetical protein